MELPVPASNKQEKIKLTEINEYLTCYLCKGYLVDATTISECLHSFCRSCIIRFLQDNSYCPVCELIINKAKPNLKTDKTLQDIVYKLVPELFLREMLRRRSFYKDYPQIAARVSPEERGEDTERTIFNPQEMISLSLEYICDDSTPGAIRIPGIATSLDTLKNNDDGSMVDSQEDSQIKRYLLCPGMCRVEVLKKFVRNKYNVDTNQFFIDLLYKRVPLPDHYTLIDIAYIYSWQRNEVMKFFFRIIDQSKSKRTDSPVNTLPQFITRNFKRTKSATERTKTASPEKKSHRKSGGKIHAAKRSSHEKHSPKPCSKQNEQRSLTKSDSKTENAEPDISRLTLVDASEESTGEETRDEVVKVEKTNDSSVKTAKVCENKVKPVKIILSKTHKDDIDSKKLDREMLANGCDVPKDSSQMESSDSVVTKVEKPDCFDSEHKKVDFPPIATIKKELLSPDSEKSDSRLILKVSKDFMDNVNIGSPKSQLFSKPVTKSFTSITLNRSENVEIITKIQPLANKDGHAIGHHIIKQTIKKGSKMKNNSPKKMSPKLNIPTLVIKKKSMKKRSPKHDVRRAMPDLNIQVKPVEVKVEPEDLETDKSKFLEYMKLKPVKVKKEQSAQNEVQQEPTVPKKQIIISRAPDPKLSGGQKRKNSSPIKNEKAKQSKLIDSKKSVKIILQEKRAENAKPDNGLQSLINSCKIPSSLSITIKEGSDKGSLPPVAPPVKNFIEILKLPEDPGSSEKASAPEIKTKLDLTKFCDKDSEQKVDEDLAEIAKSLTEKIPMSTTVSQIIGPKQNFAIPVKTNLPTKPQIQPSPVPEVSKALTQIKEEPCKQSFQKIFEESLKKPPENPKPCAVEEKASAPSNSNKRNILEIASDLIKKSKKDDEKRCEVPLPKVPIPRLPSQKASAFHQLPKFIPQTVASLHSTSLGLNYTVSVGQQSPTKVMKSNGIVSPVKADAVPGVPECKPPVSPINEPKSIKANFKVPSPSVGSPKLPEVSGSPKPKTSSPKSSPAVKSAFGVTNKPLPPPMARPPNITPRPNKPKPSKSPSPILVPKTSPLASSSGANQEANDILAKYNIPNLAQLTANYNIANPTLMATNNPMAAFQQAVLLKHFELQNRQNWLNMNQGPLMQYEKYLESLNGGINGSHSHT
ncbi:polycomb group protein Psc-like [Anthonomus grandis grandis]|uniref:polycomb group protein Psc-like n=1 Tax=Anthonomus grandis grandis TaxID=2921223 RepID=UPI00216521C6|nr:polycomb group protein Psc-like [Anthonomus grandis grandis]XP_050300206.1 polycomb group protein Psc-like [Anthonomus grandis grandis]